MSISGIIALVAGVVTAGCAIAGAIAGIRARKAQEARNEEMRRAEHEARLESMRDRRNRHYVETVQYVPAPNYQQTTNGEVHHYYHTAPNQLQFPMYPAQCQYQYPCEQNTYQNQGYVYNEPVWRGEQQIGEYSRMNYFQNIRNALFPQYQQPQYGYYPQANYAYAV